MTESNKITVAQACLERLGQQYVRQCLEHHGEGPIPREADVASFACWHICEARTPIQNARAAKVIAACRAIALKTGRVGWLWLDALIWDLCAERVEGAGERGATDCLVNNLTHHSSCIREFLYDLAWIVRGSFSLDVAGPLLLKNVADTLGGWGRAFDLCAAMCEDPDAFFSLGHEYSFGKFQEQYETRIKYAEDHGLEAFLASFYRLENEVIGRIQSVALELPTYDLM